MKKLTFHRETLRLLTSDYLLKVGAGGDSSWKCFSTFFCPMPSIDPKE